jgi:hypothetical protein
MIELYGALCGLTMFVVFGLLAALDIFSGIENASEDHENRE